VLAASLVLLAVVIVALWLARGRRDAGASGTGTEPAGRHDTTLGEFHDMREALRPLEHDRAASRRVPQGRR
jgi:hypothetical protein